MTYVYTNKINVTFKGIKLTFKLFLHVFLKKLAVKL